MYRRRAARRTARRTTRRTAHRMRRRRVFRPVPVGFRRPVIRRPLGSLLIVGATAGVAYKLGKDQAQQIQEYTGYPPDQLSEEDLQSAMTDLSIQTEPLDADDKQAIAEAQSSAKGTASSEPSQSQPAGGGDDDYIEQLKELANLRDQGVITEEEFEKKKKQLLGI